MPCALLLAQFYPHEDYIDYLEDYRGQYHFSPRSEWMNDINGLVYQGGKYHMIYQWGDKIRHGGYATSPDLLHWKDEGVALIPQGSFLSPQAVRNVSGEHVFSGSAVVVSGETARKITGSEKEAIIAIYTGTNEGTCLAWSNDIGATWHDYRENPVAHPAERAYPRDPCVLWHEASSKWILLLYEDGTTFYSSIDLIQWDSISNVDFGFECPDFFELPVDGDENNRKWVLQDANGSYLVGTFDGTVFRKDPRQDTLIMTHGPDFYAGQTFPMGNLPDNDPRVIQIAWMDHWNGGIGEIIWERNATFPVTLGLVTHDGQVRITRSPIREIASLYEDSKQWNDQVITKGTNLLANHHSKKFDLIATFDLSETEATKIDFRVANKTITYDIEKETLLGESCKPDGSGQLTIRLLVDWGQLEVFAQNGIFSYSEQFAFTPERDDLELSTDGNVTLVSMELYEIRRIW
jgi:levanase/fructan beta-fructosidase